MTQSNKAQCCTQHCTFLLSFVITTYDQTWVNHKGSVTIEYKTCNEKDRFHHFYSTEHISNKVSVLPHFSKGTKVIRVLLAVRVIFHSVICA